VSSEYQDRDRRHDPTTQITTSGRGTPQHANVSTHISFEKRANQSQIIHGSSMNDHQSEVSKDEIDLNRYGGVKSSKFNGREFENALDFLRGGKQSKKEQLID